MSENKINYKDTLNLPKISFPMKANLPQREPTILTEWKNQDIYKILRDSHKGKKKFILHDGPPYANGDIHIGHALNKTLKDIIIKYKTMRGFDAPYIPGWDCHGLPVEHQLFKELGKNKNQISQVEFRKKAHNYALKYVNKQKEQFKRLGIFGDWENPYLTLNHNYEYWIVKSLSELVKKGYIYRGLKPVNWCSVCETALAEAEVEYEDHTSPSIYVKFKIKNPGNIDDSFKRKDVFLVIWTTTPWTLLANVAVAAHPNFNYVAIDCSDEIIIAEKNLASCMLEQSNIQNYKIIKEVSGEQLNNIAYSHLFNLKDDCKVVMADYVSKDEGTGLVHTAPGHGQEDHQTGLKYNLDIVMPVDNKGKFTDYAGDLSGIHVFKANDIILDKLSKKGILLSSSKMNHSYPHCWRCKTPIIFRATKQWFLNIDHDKLRNNILKVVSNNVKWIPAIGKNRIATMVENRPHWCLSRQRYWGVPIPAISCRKCDSDFDLFPEVVEHFADLVAKEGTDAWFSRDISELLPNNFTCPSCSGNEFEKGDEILDVWFDSGVSHQAVLKEKRDLPASLYLEGSDQHRGWFQASIIPSMAIDNKPCFESVLTHGFVVDGDGRKMSKSLGNVISPQEIIKKYGADILRLWVSSCDYREDIRISNEILSRLTEAYRKIRNTVRFLIGNLFDFNPKNDKITYSKLLDIDKWALHKLKLALDSTTEAYDNFEFYKVYKTIYSFCNEDLSSVYLDILKDRLYTAGKSSLNRRAAQTVMYEILLSLVKIVTPIMPFTAEEIYKHIPKTEEVNSVHVLDWPSFDKILDGNKIIKDIELVNEKLDKIIKIRPQVLKALEDERAKGLIGSSLEAKVVFLVSNNDFVYFKNLEEQLAGLFIVSQVAIDKNKEKEETKIKIEKACGEKCQRCWNYSETVGKEKDHTTICKRCADVIKGEDQ